MTLVALLSGAAASIAFTISETLIFAGVRQWLRNRNVWLGKLVGCGYCLGLWTAFALVAIYRPRMFHVWWPLDYFLTALVVAWMAAFQWIGLAWVIQKAGK